MKKVLVIAPHPDDETLGCGGTLLKHKDNGYEIHWLIVTSMSADRGHSTSEIAQRNREIDEVATCYGFHTVTTLKYQAACLDRVALSDFVEKIGQVIIQVKPEIVFLPFEGDVHSDHRVTYQAAVSCCKTFRYSCIRKILVYETLSETEFALTAGNLHFHPNVFVPIDSYLDQKIKIMEIYKSEMQDFPFPRSAKAVVALATYRGTAANCIAAESFILIKDICEAV